MDTSISYQKKKIGKATVDLEKKIIKNFTAKELLDKVVRGNVYDVLAVIPLVPSGNYKGMKLEYSRV